jgi:hypothetical protein
MKESLYGLLRAFLRLVARLATAGLPRISHIKTMRLSGPRPRGPGRRTPEGLRAVCGFCAVKIATATATATATAAAAAAAAPGCCCCARLLLLLRLAAAAAPGCWLLAAVCCWLLLAVGGLAAGWLGCELLLRRPAHLTENPIRPWKPLGPGSWSLGPMTGACSA